MRNWMSLRHGWCAAVSALFCLLALHVRYCAKQVLGKWTVPGTSNVVKVLPRCTPSHQGRFHCGVQAIQIGPGIVEMRFQTAFGRFLIYGMTRYASWCLCLISELWFCRVRDASRPAFAILLHDNLRSALGTKIRCQAHLQRLLDASGTGYPGLES